MNGGSALPDAGGPAGRSRRLLSQVAVAVTAPYLFLKLLWLSGSTVGMVDPAALAGVAYRVANALTVLADLVLVVVVLALTRRWGQRLPATVLLLPAWVGSGLLGTVMVVVPLSAPFFRAAPPAGDALQPWVYLLVYGSLGAQGTTLLTAFALYARDRWWRRLRRACAQPPTGGPASCTLALLCAGLGLLHLTWSLGLRAGLGSLADHQTPVDRVTLAVYGMSALAVAAGLHLLERPRRRVPWWTAPLLLWCGTASLVTWGGYALTLAAWDPSLSTPALTAATAARTACGLAVVQLVRGAARRRPAARPGVTVNKGTGA